MTEPSPEQPGSKSYSRLTLIALAIAVGISLFLVFKENPTPPKVLVSLPEFSTPAKRGRQIFNRSCASCHGVNASGGAKAPSLISKAYAPMSHADGAIYLAVSRGVRRHHWNLGSMPPQPQIKPDEIKALTAFIRETQRANGIYTKVR
ncbi:MAG TPA: c-type cytochrome [Alphaproteobacteria bacterium]|nr:c-type cytochrome [Alphaproteobacteria bacterium]